MPFKPAVTSVLLTALLVALVAACGEDTDDPEGTDPPEEAGDPESPDAADDAEDPEGADAEEPEGAEGPDADDEEPENETDGVADESIVVGETEGMPRAFLSFAVEQGMLEEHGLDVEVEGVAGGAATIPAVMSGDLDMGGSNIVSVAIARSQGLDIGIIGAGTSATEDPEDDFSYVITHEDDDLDSAEDLEGRSIALTTLQSVGEIVVRRTMEQEGADHETVDFIEIPFPEMIPALEQGNVDAIWIIEPFASLAQQAGHTTLFAPYVETQPGLQIGSFFATESYMDDNPDVVAAFQAGVRDAADYVSENEDEFREALPDLMDLDPEIADAVTLPVWTGENDEESIELTVDLMVEYGLVEDPIDVSELIIAD